MDKELNTRLSSTPRSVDLSTRPVPGFMVRAQRRWPYSSTRDAAGRRSVYGGPAPDSAGTNIGLQVYPLSGISATQGVDSQMCLIGTIFEEALCILLFL